MTNNRYLDSTKPRTYKVKAGDYPIRIAKEAGISLEDLYKYNPNARKMIYPGDELRLSPITVRQKVDAKRRWYEEEKMNNIQAIQSGYHDGNYVIVDKLGRNLTVYDKNNNPIYTTSNLSTGKSGEDYNTITFTDKQGKLINLAGNNSTPAGISIIDGVGTYHGHPAFTRARVNSNTGDIAKVLAGKVGKDGKVEVTDNIASSFHFGIIGKDRKASNGCVRLGGKELDDLSKFIGRGTMVYTLPEKEGSAFTRRGGVLNFTADNPFGSKSVLDDYNVNINKSYVPLEIQQKHKSDDEEYNENVKNFISGLEGFKEKIQKDFRLSSYEYDRLANIALGLAEQESKFGTADSYKLKKSVDIFPSYITRSIKSGGRAIRQILKGRRPHNISDAESEGFTQIKREGDNPLLRKKYNQYGVDSKLVMSTPQGNAVATMLRLAYMYQNEAKAGNFTDAKGEKISPYAALLYKYIGQGYKLKNKSATPNTNSYIQNINKYSDLFNLYNYDTITY